MVDVITDCGSKIILVISVLMSTGILEKLKQTVIFNCSLEKQLRLSELIPDLVCVNDNFRKGVRGAEEVLFINKPREAAAAIAAELSTVFREDILPDPGGKDCPSLSKLDYWLLLSNYFKANLKKLLNNFVEFHKYIKVHPALPVIAEFVSSLSVELLKTKLEVQAVNTDLFELWNCFVDDIANGIKAAKLHAKLLKRYSITKL